MEAKQVKFFTSRSHIVSGWTCPRRRYYNYHYNNRGVVKSTTSLELYLGTAIHTALASIAEQYRDVGVVDIDAITTEAHSSVLDAVLQATAGEIDSNNFAHEQASLVAGLVRGYFRHPWPRIIKMYPHVMAVEKEMSYELGNGVTFLSKPDLILADDEGNWHYVEYKSTSSKREEWINSWATAVQLHSALKAVEATMGQIPADVTVLGLYKGYVSYSKQNSPMCYAYMRKGNPPFSNDLISYEYKAGLKKYPVWELDGGIAKWVDDMPEDVLADIYPMTPPIFVDQDLVDSFFKQQTIREEQIKQAMLGEITPEILDTVFEQHFEACSPGWGKGCSYKRLCFGHCDDPLKEGYEYRVSHHEPEQEALDAQ